MFDKHYLELSISIGETLRKANKTLAVAESCTGGNIGALITAVPGSSDYFNGGIIAYSNEIKESLLHVSKSTLINHGAVSEETVIEMARGAMESLKSDFAIATSGIAGPSGGTKEKPVGTVWIAACCKDYTITSMQKTDFGREKNVENAVINSLDLLKRLFQDMQK